MEQEQRLGILGGMGPQATQVFYQRILDKTDASRDQEHVPTLIWSDTGMPDRTRAILSGETEPVFARLLSGARLLFPSGFGTDELLLIAGQLTQQALLVFLTSLPALWIAVSQRAAFYPALLAVLGFAILETAGMQVSVEWLLPASLCPWTAVSVSVLVEKGGGFYFLCLLSAALCGALGLAGALRAFGKQDL